MVVGRNMKVEDMESEGLFDATKWPAVDSLFLPRDPAAESAMVEFWTAHPKDDSGMEMDEEGFENLDKDIVDESHAAGVPVDWEVSQELTHGVPPTNVMARDAASWPSEVVP